MNALNPWTPVCRIEDIPVLGARTVSRPVGLDVAIFRNAEGGVFALLDRCPHKGGPLSQGLVFDQRVACPMHNWTIGLADGCAQAPDEGCTPRFALQLVDGVVHLDARELATLATDLTRPIAGPAGRVLSPPPAGEGRPVVSPLPAREGRPLLSPLPLGEG